MNTLSSRRILKRFATSLAAIAAITTIFGAKAFEHAHDRDRAPATALASVAVR